LGRYKALAQMVGGFVHQLRTPIHIIQSSAEDLASQRWFMPNYKPQAQLLARSAQRMEASVNALLNFVKGGKLTLRPASPNDVLSLLGDFIKEESRKRSVTIEQNLQSKKSILLDPHHLQEALLNLLTNALQAMPEGGTLSIKTEDTYNKVLLTIRDSGLGMDKRTLAKVSVPFQTTKKNGMGLGLFFTRKILSQHHATLAFDSAKGRGTTVRMVFPAV
jgi:signal transduction histidine kinase